MSTHNADNERIKRRFFTYLKEAARYSEDSVDAAAAAIARFEQHTRHRDFRRFHFEQAIAFKKSLVEQPSPVTGKPPSKATAKAILGHLHRFFFWLAGQSGYKSRFTYTDADYFNLSEKDCRVASASRPRPVPTLEQLHHVLDSMPADSLSERRNRAVFALILLTGARDSAVASFRLKHVDLANGSVFQDARDVRTKFSKTFTTCFFPVGGQAREILADWVNTLRKDLLWGEDDPLFPATRTALGATGQFEAVGLDRKPWADAGPIRAIFRAAFAAAELPYFNPHSVRNTLVRLGQAQCKSPEDLKVWSQNLGHAQVLTTLTSYGSVPYERQAEIFRGFQTEARARGLDEDAYQMILDALQAVRR